MARPSRTPHRSSDVEFGPDESGPDEFGPDELESEASGAMPLGLPAGAAELVERVRRWIRWVGAGRLLASLGGLAIVVALGWWLLRSPTPPTEARLTSAATPTASAGDGTAVGAADAHAGALPGGGNVSATTTSTVDVVVHVAGAVNAPGVLELPAGSRVGDAIAAAGGATADGDPNTLNLAAPLADGDRVAVPVLGAVPVGAGADAGVSNAATGQPSGPVNVNSASAADLEGLPGVGPATAQAIVAHRETNGPFASVDDLEEVRGIGPAKLDALRDSVTV